jgi:Xaa-Pro aminopeptidase
MFEERRQELLRRLGPGAVAVIPAWPEHLRNGDVHHAYRPDSDLYYLTGFAEPEAVAVLATAHPEHRFALFVRPRNPERETWDGRRAGVEGAAAQFGAEKAFPIEELAKELPGYIQGATRLVARVGLHEEFDRKLFAALATARRTQRLHKREVPWEIHDPALYLGEMRLRKSRDELERLRRACAITAEGFREAMARARPGVGEWEVESLLTAAYRRNGSWGPSGAGYGHIVAGGANATVLHYRENEKRLPEGGLLLIDSGAEFEGYTADVTRTFPLGRRFSAPQRAVYEAVLEAHRAALAEVRPGSTLDRGHDAAIRVLTQAMVRLRLLEGDAEQLIKDEAYKRCFMHRTGHWLGMDVHDAGRYMVGGAPRVLEPGMVLTVEPGLYIREDDEKAPPDLRGIGVRIEDDVLVTAEGYEVLTASIPREVEDVERAAGATSA